MARYGLHQQLASIGDDFWIEDADGNRVLKVDGKVRIKRTLLLQDADGNTLFTIKQKIPALKPTMEIFGPSGRLATVSKPPFTPMHEKYTVALDGGEEWEVAGDIFDREYALRNAQGRIAEISKKKWTVRDMYTVDVGRGHDDRFVIAVALVVDAISHAPR